MLAVVLTLGLLDLVIWFVYRNRGAAPIGLMIVASVIMLGIIGGGTASKMAGLRGGGAALATSLGAVAIDPTTQDPQLRRLVNIVEEMSLASGVPMPRLFVMPREESINAFAAGFTASDAAITVTGGALHSLNRDELQGVIGHEFSHILNGDMRLNIRLIGVLAGLQLLALIGLRIVAFGGGGRRDDKNGGNPLVVIALAAVVLGFIGRFFAGLIQAAVSRQREWLADASSVQFTRQTTGLAGALKKIAGLPSGSTLRDKQVAVQVNHMLFGEGKSHFSQAWATHPPLDERIKALEPSFDPAELQQLSERLGQNPPNGLAEDAALGLTGLAPLAHSESVPATTAPAVTHRDVDPGRLVARIGALRPVDLEHGAALSSAVPPGLRRLAGQPTTALPLVLALLVEPDPTVAAAQLDRIAARLGTETAGLVQQLGPEVQALPRILRLPLAGLSIPALTTRPVRPLDELVDLLNEVARVDHVISIFEYCLTRLVSSFVLDALSPVRRSRPGRRPLAQQQGRAETLLAVMAALGNSDPAEAQRAYAAGAAVLGVPAAGPFAAPPDPVAALDGVWDALDDVAVPDKRRLIEALIATVAADGVLAEGEAELLRVACALLHCPLPALLG